ncbi:hypothetical protein AAHA92_30191 [Salvia divinorum]|uniref:Uncharacterized protein n=1 Tax=Salvia divinorum TaxID=28513 RepID=A0ABD1G0S8_SALDI
MCSLSKSSPPAAALRLNSPWAADHPDRFKHPINLVHSLRVLTKRGRRLLPQLVQSGKPSAARHSISPSRTLWTRSAWGECWEKAAGKSLTFSLKSSTRSSTGGLPLAPQKRRPVVLFRRPRLLHDRKNLMLCLVNLVDHGPNYLT